MMSDNNLPHPILTWVDYQYLLKEIQILQNRFEKLEGYMKVEDRVTASDVLIRLTDLERYVSLIKHLDNAKKDMQEQINKLEDKLAHEITMRKDLRDYCFKRLGSALSPEWNMKEVFEHLHALEQIAHSHLKENEWHAAKIIPMLPSKDTKSDMTSKDVNNGFPLPSDKQHTNLTFEEAILAFKKGEKIIRSCFDFAWTREFIEEDGAHVDIDDIMATDWMIVK